MSRTAIILSFSFMASMSAAAPTGNFECRSGDVKVKAHVTQVSIGGADMPKISIEVESGDVYTEVEGIGVRGSTRTKTNGTTQYFLKLPGTSFVLRYDRNDRLTGSSCKQL